MENIEDYLSLEERKEIATRIFTERVQSAFGGDQYSASGKEADRVIKNAVAHWITEYVENSLTAEHRELIRAGVDRAINGENYSFYLFKRPDVWDRTEYTIYTIINQALKENEEFIKNKVSESILDKFTLEQDK